MNNQIDRSNRMARTSTKIYDFKKEETAYARMERLQSKPTNMGREFRVGQYPNSWLYCVIENKDGRTIYGV